MAETATANGKKISHRDRAYDAAMIILSSSAKEPALKTGSSANFIRVLALCEKQKTCNAWSGSAGSGREIAMPISVGAREIGAGARSGYNRSSGA